MSAHTPAKWTHARGAALIFGPGKTTIAHVHGYDAESQANGDLIAAAPELLDALKLIEAITKTTVDLVSDNMLTPSESDRQLIELNKLARAALAHGEP